MNPTDAVDGVTLTRPLSDAHREILTPDALAFIVDLHRSFDVRRRELLNRRNRVQEAIDQGEDLGFADNTREIREGDWTIDPVPDDLQDRRVEITGPVDRKMIINAMNSGASAFMADFEDSHAPTWEGTLDGQVNLRDAVERTIAIDHPDGRIYRLNPQTATLIVRPRGWHLPEKHVLVDGVPMAAAFFDFGLFCFHNARKLIDRGSGPYFYLPKLESHLEARLWNDVFDRAEVRLDLPLGAIKATVLIETLPAAFEMDEILYELRHHGAGLNCGRWDYIFSFIKRYRNRPAYLFPDRGQITMTRHCMHSYSLLAIRTCHRRRAHAVGGMAAQIPIRDDPEANAAAFARVREDKIREAGDGHDGTWVAHPGLVAVAREVFDESMPGPHQIARQRTDVAVGAADLLQLPRGTITEAGLRTNVRVAIQYIAHWLNGLGCVPLYHLMEDAATAEISRTQVWQWLHHPEARLDGGEAVTQNLVAQVISEEMDGLRRVLGPEGFRAVPHDAAATLFSELTMADDLDEFLTLKAYARLD